MGYHSKAGLLVRSLRKVWRNSRLKSTHLCANDVRQHFIDYFKASGHSYIRSSPVRPFADPTLEFVNAGMNQFKNVFLGLRPSPASSATNSQKCIRIGGKHNDLDVVGHDTYHHTFFEMLGNWSFGSYFKKEACELAWKLITSPPFSLPADRLYVTYFGGNAALELKPDLETRDIWLSIGVKPDRILPFGLKDNFWEMGLTGPCGPCTEIHYDHLGSAPRPESVNKDLTDLTELWNLVFIQYNREESGILTPLQQSFVDTGMGFERLVAVLQKKSSNYDTDLFWPLFNEIHRICKVPEYGGRFGSVDSEGLRDTAYRTLADHVRMITVAIADNIFPYQSHGLRRVLRKALRIADSLAPGKASDVIIALSKVAISTLESAYPETSQNTKQVEFVIRDEFLVWQLVLSSTSKQWQSLLQRDPSLDKLSDVLSPGLIGGLKELEKHDLKSKTVLGMKTLPVDLALILFDRYGIDEQLIEELSSLKGYSYNQVELRSKIDELKLANKKALDSITQASTIRGESSLLPASCDSARYDYIRTLTGDYVVPELTSNVTAVISGSNLLRVGTFLTSGSEVSVALDETNCWSSQKGDTDRGTLSLLDESGKTVGSVEFRSVSRSGNQILHTGTFMTLSKTVPVGKWKAKVAVDSSNRIALMRNVTASHLLAHALRDKYVGHLSRFLNTKDGFTMNFVIYDPNASEAGLILLEHSVNHLVKLNLPVNLMKISLNELLGNDDIFVPFVINRQSDHFPLIHIPLAQNRQGIREVSYGPNLFRTGDIEEFCLVDVVFSRKQREVTFKCITGPQVDRAYIATEGLLNELRSFDENCQISELDSGIAKAKQLVSGSMVPMCFRIELNHLVQGIEKLRKNKVQKSSVKSLEDVMKEAKVSELGVLVHFVGEECKLEKLTKKVNNMPVILFAYNRGHLTGRCCTPLESQIDADVWMGKVAELLGTEPSFFKGHDGKRVCGLKPLKMTKKQLAEINSELLTIAEKALPRID